MNLNKVRKEKNIVLNTGTALICFLVNQGNHPMGSVYATHGKIEDLLDSSALSADVIEFAVDNEGVFTILTDGDGLPSAKILQLTEHDSALMELRLIIGQYNNTHIGMIKSTLYVHLTNNDDSHFTIYAIPLSTKMGPIIHKIK
jgi:hypothetical protein